MRLLATPASTRPLSHLLTPLRSCKTTVSSTAVTSNTGRKAIADSMEPGSAFKLLLSCPSGLPRSRVYVDFDSSYDRIPHPDADLEESINELWNGRTQENPSLYNGQKFRYGGHAVHYVDGLVQEFSVCLHLGLTEYRTFVGTNLNPLWEKFLIFSEDDSIRCRHTSSPLGNGAIVETADKKILVLQRSSNVGEFPGYFVFPGGHSEPQEVGISVHQNDKGTAESGLLNGRVSQEMFDGIIREVVEEIGVPAESLADPVFIGISRRDLNVRPTAFFFSKCNLKSEEIYQLYSGAQDRYESTQLYTVSRVCSARTLYRCNQSLCITLGFPVLPLLMKAFDSQDELASMASRMPGCHRGGHALYELMIKSGKET